jgi:hypothetical protein
MPVNPIITIILGSTLINGPSVNVI